MKGAEIIGTLLRSYEPLTDMVPPEVIQMGSLDANAPMDMVLARTVSLVDQHFLRNGAWQHSVERVAVAVRASDYLTQVALIKHVRAALRGFTGALLDAERIAIHTSGLGPDLRGPGGSFEQTQDFRVSYDAPA